MTAEQALDLAEEKAKQIKRKLKPLADGKMCPICGSDSSHLCYVSKDDDVWAKCLRCGSRVLIKENGDLVSRQAVIDAIDKWVKNMGVLIALPVSEVTPLFESIHELPSVKPQTTGHCKDCKYFEYDSVAKVDGIPIIVAHEICSKWGDGCKTREDGYCFLFEPQESEENNG